MGQGLDTPGIPTDSLVIKPRFFAKMMSRLDSPPGAYTIFATFLPVSASLTTRPHRQNTSSPSFPTLDLAPVLLSRLRQDLPSVTVRILPILSNSSSIPLYQSAALPLVRPELMRSSLPQKIFFLSIHSRTSQIRATLFPFLYCSPAASFNSLLFLTLPQPLLSHPHSKSDILIQSTRAPSQPFLQSHQFLDSILISFTTFSPHSPLKRVYSPHPVQRLSSFHLPPSAAIQFASSLAAFCSSPIIFFLVILVHSYMQIPNVPYAYLLVTSFFWSCTSQIISCRPTYSPT